MDGVQRWQRFGICDDNVLFRIRPTVCVFDVFDVLISFFFTIVLIPSLRSLSHLGSPGPLCNVGSTSHLGFVWVLRYAQSSLSACLHTGRLSAGGGRG